MSFYKGGIFIPESSKIDLKLQKQIDFFKELNANDHGESLFNYLQNILFFIKDRDGRFIKVNQPFLEKYGYRYESDIIGKDDSDLSPDYLKKNYDRDDNYVLKTGKSIINKVELVTGKNGIIDWYITDKIPLKDKNNNIIGLAGITRYFQKADASIQPYSKISEIVNYINLNYNKKIDIDDLCRNSNLSLSALEKKFKKIFCVSPVKYIIMIRIGEACKMLTNTNMSLAQITSNTGFTDQSHFSREFKKIVAMTPKDYRKNYSV